MKLFFPQLQDHLKKKNLLPIYFISSDEYFLSQEAVMAIRHVASAHGFSERVSIVAESQQNWVEPLMAAIHHLSLFSDKKIIELNLTQINLNATVGKAISDALPHLSDHVLLVVQTCKSDAKNEKSAWYQAIEKKGATLAIWPIPPKQLSQWITERAKKLNIALTPMAVEQLTRLTEGNLRVTDQAIQKLALMTSDKIVDHTTIAFCLSDDSRFGLFDLVNSALASDSARCIRVLKNLKDHAIEPILVLWVLTREVRASIARLSKGRCAELLMRAATIDRIIKGAVPGEPWQELEKMTLSLSGSTLA